MYLAYLIVGFILADLVTLMAVCLPGYAHNLSEFLSNWKFWMAWFLIAVLWPIPIFFFILCLFLEMGECWW